MPRQTAPWGSLEAGTCRCSLLRACVLCLCVPCPFCFKSQIQGWLHILVLSNKEACKISGIPQKGPEVFCSVLVSKDMALPQAPAKPCPGPFPSLGLCVRHLCIFRYF